MEQIDSSPVVSNTLKRPAPSDATSPEKKPLNLKGSQFVMPTPPDTDQSSNASPSCTYDAATRDVSPAPSHSTLTSIDMASPVPERAMDASANGAGPANEHNTDQSSMSGQPPAKRRKLTLAEKEEQQRAKEAKATERAEQKAKRDEEKRLKDEERQRKAVEKEEEKRLRDEEKQKKADAKEAKRREKEAEEEKKVEAKLKKERSQMRLGAFFQLPSGGNTPTKSSEDQANGSARRKSLSLEPFDAAAERIRASQSPCKRTPHKTSADYYDFFKPFHLPSHSSLPTTFVRGQEDVAALQEGFDEAVLSYSSTGEHASIQEQFASERSRRGVAQPGLRRLIDQIQGSVSSEPIDLTDDAVSTNPWTALHDISRRHIQFQEDVRPAYFGTYTKILSPRTCTKIRRNPFTKGREDTDYDYDSEAEWQEEEEGEDIMGEEDDEAESVAEAGEMDEFLDDEDDSLKGKRKLITGDLEPTSTGICWENERGRIISSVETEDQPNEMRGMSLTFLLPGLSSKTIDPFSTEYWTSREAATSTTAVTAVPAPTAPIRESPFTPAASVVMAPPRPPLGPRPNSHSWPENSRLIGAAEGMKGPITSATGQPKAKPGPKPAAKILSEEDLEEFKEAVVGSPLSKADLLKGLKSRFPKITSETIKASLGEHFAQIGASKADKKWVFVPKS